jgi:hypothetical protein
MARLGPVGFERRWAGDLAHRLSERWRIDAKPLDRIGRDDGGSPARLANNFND